MTDEPNSGGFIHDKHHTDVADEMSKHDVAGGLAICAS